MPKLSKEQAKSVAENEGGFPLLDEGVYYATLFDCSESDGPGNSGYPYWTWVFDSLVSVDTGEAQPGRQFHRTSLSPQAEWKLKETYDAFGVEPGTDTDELIGSDVKLSITQRIIEGGSRDGQMGNNIDQVLAVDAATPPSMPAPEEPKAKPTARKAAARKTTAKK